MSGPIRTTLLIALIAIFSSLIAAYYYPWQQTEALADTEGKPLFKEYSTARIKEIKIQSFNEEKRQLDQIVLKNRGNTWIVPAQFDHIADRNILISAITTSLNNLEVIKVESEEQKDHQEYGVVDPVEYQGDPIGIGTKLVMSDINGRDIASLIIGKPVDDKKTGPDANYYVRRPGQPAIYEVKFNKQILTTEFANWLNPNRFRLALGRGDQIMNTVRLRNYLVDAKILADNDPSNDKKTNLFTAELETVNNNQGQWKTRKLVAYKKDGTPVELSGGLRPPTMQPGHRFLQFLVNLPIIDVAIKPDEMVQRFKNLVASPLTAPDVKSLNEIGFYFDKETGFEGSRGHIEIETQNRTILHIVLGGIQTQSSDSQIKRFIIGYATIDEKNLPAKPKPLTAEEEKDPDKKVKYGLALKDYNNALNIAKNSANEINQQFAKWIYLIDDQATQFMSPGLKDLFLQSTLSLEKLEEKTDGGSDAEKKKGDADKSNKKLDKSDTEKSNPSPSGKSESDKSPSNQSEPAKNLPADKSKSGSGKTDKNK